MIRLLPLLMLMLMLSACAHMPAPSCANARVAAELAREAIERVCRHSLQGDQ